jgi:hypothetical protein
VQRRFASKDLLEIQPISPRIEFDQRRTGVPAVSQFNLARRHVEEKIKPSLRRKLSRRFATGGAKAKVQYHYCEHNMKPGVGGIVRDHPESVSTPNSEAPNSDDRIDDSENLEPSLDAPAPAIPASRKMIPEAMWTTLCAALT